MLYESFHPSKIGKTNTHQCCTVVVELFFLFDIGKMNCKLQGCGEAGYSSDILSDHLLCFSNLHSRNFMNSQPEELFGQLMDLLDNPLILIGVSVVDDDAKCIWFL